MTGKRLSFIVPARNEEALIAEVIEAILDSIALSVGVPRDELWLPDTAFEVIVADDGSEDATASIVRRFHERSGVQLVACHGRSCGAARNAGAAAAHGAVLSFVDADTIVPTNAASRILELHEDARMCFVLYRLASREPGARALMWWTFWGFARRLPFARAKSLPAFSSCNRTHFEKYGPFSESVLIAEEWPLTGAAYRFHRDQFLYDRSTTARTSSRRMELQPFGYVRTFLKWAAVVLFPGARTTLDDRIRHKPAPR